MDTSVLDLPFRHNLSQHGGPAANLPAPPAPVFRAPGTGPGARKELSGRHRRWLVMPLLLAVAMAGRPALGEETPPPPAPPKAPAPSEDTAAGKAPATGDSELLPFADIPVVVSAARQVQPVNWLSVPVSIVTANDIHYSGLTTIPDILPFVPGVDVLQIDRNFYAVGVRGLHGRYSNRLLSLVDGRGAESPVYGGPEFSRLPLFLEDIKQIEVVRGPGGAAWGANAFTGVINIITKDPEESLGWLASTTWNHFGDSYNHVRWAAKANKWSWRVSVGYEDRETSEDALHDDDFSSHDFSRSWRFDNMAVYKASEATKWSMGLGYSHIEAGNYDSGSGVYAREPRRFETARSFVKVDHKSPGGGSGHLQWFGNFAGTKYVEAVNSFTSENDIEGQYNFAVARDHKVSVGGNIRWNYITASVVGGDEAYTFRDMPVNEYWTGAFVIDRWQVSDRLTLEGQLRGDWYSETQADWSARVTALYALDKLKRRVLRGSAGKAFRAPLVVSRRGQKHAGLMFPGTYFFNILAPMDLDNEETWTLELGYTERITNWLTFRSDFYYQRFDRLIGDRALPDPRNMGRILLSLDNLGGADSYGTEMELTAKNKTGELSAWYAFNEFQEDYGHQQVEAYLPAKNLKVVQSVMLRTGTGADRSAGSLFGKSRCIGWLCR